MKTEGERGITRPYGKQSKNDGGDMASIFGHVGGAFGKVREETGHVQKDNVFSAEESVSEGLGS